MQYLSSSLAWMTVVVTITGCNPGSISAVGTGLGGNNNNSQGGESGSGDNNNNGGGAGGDSTLPPFLPTLPVGATPPDASECKTNAPGPRVLRRLSTLQLAASLRSLLSDPALSVASVVDDPVALGFSVDASGLLVRGLDADRIRSQAEELANKIATTKLSSVTSCQTNDATCRQQFIKAFGKRAFRAPLSDAQVKAYETIFTGEATFSEGVEAVLTAMLQSPYFLYRSELGAPQSGGSFKLTQFEIATALSYLLLGTTPDDTLLAAAEANQLGTQEQILKQADRLMANASSADVVVDFFKGWLDLDLLRSIVKDDKVFALSDELRADMLSETRSFVADLYSSKAAFGQMFTADYSFINGRLKQHYGFDVSLGTETGMTKFTLPAGKRDPGILAHASLLTAHSNATASSPTFRGKMVRTRLLCQALPPPPANLDTMLKAPQANQTTRERFMQHSQSSACAGCHRQMDPIGFGFEGYDGVGRKRDTDAGKPVDDSGELTDIDGEDFTFRGVQELATKLSTSQATKACLVRFWSYYAYGMASWDNDACTYEAVQGTAAKDNYSFKGVLTGIINAPHFTQRVKDL
ncbi:MAG: DUF1592 domain-containing protein [Deltaproteobacteria bacterium]|nr:DUF1592 domain-containing protein [Deltaproteobacteria bacterium]